MHKLWTIPMALALAVAGCSGKKTPKPDDEPVKIDSRLDKGPATQPSTARNPALDPMVWQRKHFTQWLEELTNKDPEVRAHAANAMANFGPKAKDAAPALGEMLKDANIPLRH